MKIIRRCQSIYDEKFTLEINEEFLKRLDRELYNSHYDVPNDLTLSKQDIKDAIEDEENDTLDIIIRNNFGELSIRSFIREFVDNDVWNLEPELYHNETLFDWQDEVCD